MTLATQTAAGFNAIIATFGSNANLYAYSGASKTSDDEGKETVSDWKTATAIQMVEDEHVEIRKLKVEQGDEVNGDGVFYIRSDVTIAMKDKISFNSLNYTVSEIHPVRLNGTIQAQKIIINRT